VLVALSGAVERIAGTVNSHKSLARCDGTEEGGLAAGAHGRLLVLTRSGDIPCRIEEEGVVLLQARVEDRAILACRHVKAVRGAKLYQGCCRSTESAAVSPYHIVFILCRLGKEEHVRWLLLRFPLGAGQ
jgi:hypothetical protein